jgi:hypothetical protein
LYIHFAVHSGCHSADLQFEMRKVDRRKRKGEMKDKKKWERRL